MRGTLVTLLPTQPPRLLPFHIVHNCTITLLLSTPVCVSTWPASLVTSGHFCSSSKSFNPLLESFQRRGVRKDLTKFELGCIQSDSRAVGGRAAADRNVESHESCERRELPTSSFGTRGFGWEPMCFAARFFVWRCCMLEFIGWVTIEMVVAS